MALATGGRGGLAAGLVEEELDGLLGGPVKGLVEGLASGLAEGLVSGGGDSALPRFGCSAG